MYIEQGYMPALTVGAWVVLDVDGGSLLVRSLEAVDVEVVFGVPGGTILPAYDPLLDSIKVRHLLVRHEQGAGHAAIGKAGVCMATSRLGATNLVTPIADAHMDSVPFVAIIGQRSRALIGTDAFQEADICGMTMRITKHNFLVIEPADIARAIAGAFHLASTGRPGPVLVALPQDVLQEQTSFTWSPGMHPGYRPTLCPHGKQVREAAKPMATVRRPVLYVGGGVIKAQAHEELKRLAELTGIPVVTTLVAWGSFPDSPAQQLGVLGMHCTVPGMAAMQRGCAGGVGPAGAGCVGGRRRSRGGTPIRRRTNGPYSKEYRHLHVHVWRQLPTAD